MDLGIHLEPPLETLLITGGSGLLGRSLVRRAEQRARVVATTHREPLPNLETHPFDLALDDPAPLLDRLRPHVVIHAAAVNPGQGSDAQMVEVNHLGTERLAAAAARSGCRRLVVVSTDVVHDGTAGPYSDDAPATASSAYGRSKAEGESSALTQFPGALAVRTSLIYGLETPDRGTASFVRRLDAGEEVHLFRDVLRQPIWVETLAHCLVSLALDSTIAGTLNVAGEQVLSREEFGRKMLGYWGSDPGSPRIVAVDARRVAPGVPRDLRLDLDRVRLHLAHPLPGVDEVLSAKSS